jgi:L-alanine-DL-glutamate epimerase-like enolase superfamily enzyme
MKIKKISPICIHMPFEHGAEKKELYGQNWKKLEFVFVKVEMDNGVIGWGEAFGYVSWKPVKVAIEEMVAPLLIGSKVENSNDIIEISNKIQKTLHIFGRYGITMFAISGIEIAIWDALGKDKKVPLHELLGKKKKSEFSAYASLFRYSNNNLVEKKCQEAIDRGFQIIKLHEIEEEYISSARNYLGADFNLMTDFNCSWTIDKIIDKKDFFKKVNLFWLEEPIYPPEDFEKLSIIRDKCNIPVALGENACTSLEFEKMLKYNAVDFCQPSVIKVGGISEMIKILNLSEKNNKKFMPHTAYFGPGFLATLHIASLTNKETFIERFWLDLAEEFYPGFVNTKNGKYLLPDGHGLGYDINEKLINKFKVN